MVLHGQIGKLGEKRSRTEINIMLKKDHATIKKIGEKKKKKLALK